ncbi:hypothetical protein ACWDTT_33305 [Streptosporangium sandarakinum]
MGLNVLSSIADFGRDVKLWFVQENAAGEVEETLDLSTGDRIWLAPEPHTAPAPTLTLTRAEAELLCTELSRALGGSANARMIQADRDTALALERARVDKLIDGMLNHRPIIVTGGQVNR